MPVHMYVLLNFTLILNITGCNYKGVLNLLNLESLYCMCVFSPPSTLVLKTTEQNGSLKYSSFVSDTVMLWPSQDRQALPTQRFLFLAELQSSSAWMRMAPLVHGREAQHTTSRRSWCQCNNAKLRQSRRSVKNNTFYGWCQKIKQAKV